MSAPNAEYVQVGTWLLPEAYGPDYDHFTQTRMESVPGRCIALYAKAADLAAQNDGSEASRG